MHAEAGAHMCVSVCVDLCVNEHVKYVRVPFACLYLCDYMK